MTDLAAFDALIFDMDGVLTDTVSLHMRAWKETFDDYLERKRGDDARPFTEEDYRRYVDGKPRYEGARSFLESREVELPRGEPDDPPDRESVCGLGNRKNERFRELLDEEGVELFHDAAELVRSARERGRKTAVITSSRNGARVLEAAGVRDLFDVALDGRDADDLGLSGKPDPDIFLEAARRLDVEPERAAVFEDSAAGVEAGRAGGFGRVVGVARDGDDGLLREAGADVVVRELTSVRIGGAEDGEDADDGGGADETGGEASDRIRDLPSALERFGEVWGRIGPRPVLLLDYDGTLTPIVDDPAEAHLPDGTRSVLEELAPRCTVAVVSGRDLDDLRGFVRVEGLFYAGSHGLHLREPDGRTHTRADDWLPLLDRAEEELEPLEREVEGVSLERKRFGLAVHYRRADRSDVPRVRRRAEAVAEQVAMTEEVAVELDDTAAGPTHDGLGLRLQEGKEVVELRPDLEWDKGNAVEWVLETAVDEARSAKGGSASGAPLYLGDDVTDEDGFRGLPDVGVGIVVRGEDDDRRTVADYALADPDEVRDFLARVRDALDRPHEARGSQEARDSGAERSGDPP